MLASLLAAARKPDDDDARFSVTDGRLTFEMTVAPYFWPRSMCLAPDNEFREGEVLEATAVSEVDRWEWEKRFMGLEGSVVQLTVPRPLVKPRPGGVPGVLLMQLVAVEACRGAVGCEASINTDFSTPATLLP